jgi:hypothetical protein
MIRLRILAGRAALAGLLGAGSLLQAQELAPSDFAWHATVDAAPHQGLVRLPLPAEALLRLQSATAADLRVFDARSQPVPFALATSPQPAAGPRPPTRPFAALPLWSAQPGERTPAGSVQVRVEDGGQRQSVWVQLAPGADAAATGAQRLPSALFDTRSLQDRIGALVLRGQLPPNVPVQVTLSTSSDLASWTPVPLQGRVYRFEGADAPANDTLELDAPLALAGRFLRLDWAGQQGVRIDAVTGLLATPQPPGPRPTATLAAPQADGPAALVWATDFATPLAALELTTGQANTLVPLRILGRNQPSEPWRVLGHTVLYRLGPPGQESRSQPLALPHPSVRWLRVEATHGTRLQGLPLAARVQFDPLETVFVAGQSGPWQLVAGRPATPAAALPLSMLAGTTRSRPEDLPAARITAVRSHPPAPLPAWARWLPAGTDPRSAGLWLVLALGLLVLGAVAWSLLRQLNGGAAPRP